MDRQNLSSIRSMSKDNLLKLHFSSLNSHTKSNSNNNNSNLSNSSNRNSSRNNKSNNMLEIHNNGTNSIGRAGLNSEDQKIIQDLNSLELEEISSKFSSTYGPPASLSRTSSKDRNSDTESSSDDDLSIPLPTSTLKNSTQSILKSPLDNPILKFQSDSEEESELVVSTSKSPKLLYPNNINNNNINSTDQSNIENIKPTNDSNNNNQLNQREKKDDLPTSSVNIVEINGVRIDRTSPVTFNVGGTLFATSLNTILRAKDSLLYKIVEMQIHQIQKDQIIFIDRNPIYFSCILDYLRTLKYFSPSGQVNTAALLEEATFFKVKGLELAIKDEPELTRTDIVKILNSCYDFPRLQGLWLNKANLTGLDLSCALLNYSNLSYCIISNTTMNQASFANCRMDGAIINTNIGSNCVFNRASIINANFQDNTLHESQGYFVNFTGSNLTGTNFACSDLKGSKFVGAILYGCDLSHCDLTECDFTNAKFDETTNISCAILTNAIFEGCNKEKAFCKKSFKKPKSIRVKSKISTLPGMML
ncbi:BTB/POZ domain-containing protein [Heterostelium album PN500]|uniref:BTB/POZ domain-containing protein n=1 Tax=Heterostelium pallidum (strain ATCC 26659 / Pp 5 / PN500) TaxID=670386 RepID=D3BL15_HETP5|nr:BTB/POZ domain-containing protein [Heterostelium album PN500]EFA78595.1 BTB/POZ domain-containing protein [Heterostelium album PN500]|eukprot:XP_020430719.1 BTB/POZ domain-containing protein [Heterostelium album PN500]